MAAAKLNRAAVIDVDDSFWRGDQRKRIEKSRYRQLTNKESV